MKIGLKEVPAIVMELDDTSSAEIALVENIQRKDLTAIEEAKSYEKILELGQLNQEELAKRVGRNQSTVSNKLRLLNLSEEAQQALLDNKISERHARSLLRLKDKIQQNDMLNNIIENRMTVRETDKEIKNLLGENNVDSTEIEEIIDIENDIPAINDTETNIIEQPKIEIPIVPTVEIPNNEVFINPEIIPPEETSQNINTNELVSNNILSQNDFVSSIPNFDQINTIQNDSNIPNTITENNTQTGPFGGRFFNLDNESANMNMDNPFTQNSSNYIDPTQFTPNGIPNFDEHQINPQNTFNEPINNSSIPVPPQPIIQRQDITGAVAVIRNTVMNLQNNGYVITTNEQDLGDSHQIIIEIKK